MKRWARWNPRCSARSGIGGLFEDRRTGELLYSKFFHRDSRPINGLSDPHWHVHCFLHNATFDPIEERWKAGQFRGLIADKGYYQEYFHTLLAQRLTESGYRLETVTLESNGKVRQFKPSAKGKWDVLVSSAMQVSVGDQIRVTAGFREGKNVFKNNDVAQVREITNTELVLHDGRRMRRDGARIDQGVCMTSHASQCRTVDQVVALPDGADAKGWYVSLSRARAAMHVYTRNKTALRQSVMQAGERKSVWELLQAVPRSKVQSRNRIMPDLWATRQAQIVRAMEMER